MLKRWSVILIIMMLTFSIVLGSLNVYAAGTDDTSQTEDDPNGDGTENPGEPTDETGEEGDGTGEEENTYEPVKNNNGASQSLEGYELVSPDSDEEQNPDIYFNKNNISLKFVHKNKDGSIKHVYSSNLSLDDLGIVLPEVDPEPAKEDPDYEAKMDVIEEQKAARRAEMDRIHSFDRQSLSLMTFTYVNLGNNLGNVNEVATNSFQQPHYIVEDSYNPTGQGITFKIHFSELNITVPLLFEVDGQSIIATIPNDGIYENIEGAEAIQNANTKIDDLINDISEMVADIKKLVKNKTDRDEASNSLASITGEIDLIRQELSTGQMKTGSITKLDNDVRNLNRRFEDRGLFSKYSNNGKLEKFVEDVVKYAEECSELFAVMRDEIAYGIYKLELMPFLGASTIKEEGYVFYPDGAGAISYFNVIHPSALGYFSKDIYREQTMSAFSVFGSGGSEYIKIPVYGIVKENSAFLAIIDEGDYDASISFFPGNEEYVLSRVYSSYYFRRKIQYIRNTGRVDVYDTKRIEYNRRTKYVFLSDEEADYSGMANTYREYLQEKGMLNDVITDGERIPMMIDFLMAARKEEVFGYSTVPMTTFNEVKSLYERLRADGVNNRIYTNMEQWNTNDNLPNKLNVNRTLGGKSDLLDLTEYARNNNIVLGVYVDPTRAVKGYATSDQMKNHLTKDSIGMPIQYKVDTNDFVMAFFSPTYIGGQFFDKQVSKLQEYGLNSISIGRIGDTIYYDYGSDSKDNPDSIVQRKETAEIFSGLARNAAAKLDNASVSTGNQYMWSTVTKIDGLSLSDTGYMFTDQSVPFLQMLLHGNIPYSGWIPYNTMHDAVHQKLEYVEYGCMPGFMLTTKDISEMQFTDTMYDYDFLYSADIETWYDRMLEIYKEFDENMGDLWDDEIVHHSHVQDNVVRVEYSDGTVIYINYKKEAVEFTDKFNNETVNMDAQTYIVRKGA